MVIINPRRAPVIAPRQGLPVRGQAPPEQLRKWPLMAPKEPPMTTPAIIFNIVRPFDIFNSEIIGSLLVPYPTLHDGERY